MKDEELQAGSEAYLDRLFGEGEGRKHSRFLEGFDSEELQRVLHGYHLMEGNTEHISVVENYMLGMCVLLAVRVHGTAAMFAKTLRHLGVPREKILEAVTRMSMWIGGVPAAEAAVVIQRAMREWDEKGRASLAGWFPEDKGASR